jgi:hypothetical protein
MATYYDGFIEASNHVSYNSCMVAPMHAYYNGYLEASNEPIIIDI